MFKVIKSDIKEVKTDLKNIGNDVVYGVKSRGTFIEKNKLEKNKIDLNQLIVRIRSMAFFITQIDILRDRFTLPDAEADVDELVLKSNEIVAAHLEEISNLFESAGKLIARHFAQRLVFQECYYMFDHVYAKKKEGNTLADVIRFEKPQIIDLIRLMRSPVTRSIKSKRDEGYRIVADDFHVWVCQEVGNNFYHAWTLIILEKFRDEIPINFDTVNADSDTLRNLSEDLSEGLCTPGYGAIAQSTLLASNQQTIAKRKDWVYKLWDLVEDKEEDAKKAREIKSTTRKIFDDVKLDIKKIDDKVSKKWNKLFNNK